MPNNPNHNNHSSTEQMRTPIDPYVSPENSTKETMFCRFCGNKIQANVLSCPFCHQQQIDGKTKNKFVAAALGFFLGFLGAHRFYLGKWWGVFYLIFGLVGWAVAIVESIVFIFTPQQSWERKYSNVAPSNAGIVVAGVIGAVIFIGILAAIALPAYQDYTYRAKVDQAINKVIPIKNEMNKFFRSNLRFAATFDELGMQPDLSPSTIDSITLSNNGSIKLIFSEKGNSIIGEETMIWTPIKSGNELQWDCSGGTLPSKFRPPACRSGSYSKQQFSETTQKATDDHGYFELRVPSHWAKRNDLNEVAIFQMGNVRKEEYMIVIEDSFQELPGYTLAEYTELQNNALTEQDFKVSVVKPLEINGNNSLQFKVSGVVENTNIDYLITYIEGKERYYLVMMWTLASKKSQVFPTFKAVMQTFTENQVQ